MDLRMRRRRSYLFQDCFGINSHRWHSFHSFFQHVCIIIHQEYYHVSSLTVSLRTSVIPLLLPANAHLSLPYSKAGKFATVLYNFSSVFCITFVFNALLILPLISWTLLIYSQYRHHKCRQYHFRDTEITYCYSENTR